MPASEAKSEDAPYELSELASALDMETFNQILEMDDGDDHDFSKEIVFGFFEQAEETFGDMDQALEEEDLEKLSSLGHFLKGSSATLGLAHVRDHCEKIQRFGKKENEDGSSEPDEALCLKRIKETLPSLKKDYNHVEEGLKKYYGAGDTEASGADSTSGDKS